MTSPVSITSQRLCQTGRVGPTRVGVGASGWQGAVCGQAVRRVQRTNPKLSSVYCWPLRLTSRPSGRASARGGLRQLTFVAAASAPYAGPRAHHVSVSGSKLASVAFTTW